MKDMNTYRSLTNEHSEEKFVLASGLNDILIAIGIGLFSLGIFIQAELAMPSLSMPRSSTSWTSFFYSLMGLGFSWGLSEYLTKRRKLVLPSMMLAISIGAFSYVMAISIFASFPEKGWKIIGIEEGTNKAKNMMVALCPVGVLLAYYLRFRFPFTLCILGVTLILAALMFFELFFENFLNGEVFFFSAGCLVFLWAMRFDLKDPERQTRFSDCAFWLHLLAAPLLVGALMHMLVPDFSMISSRQAIIVALLVFVLGFIAIVIDRRSLFMAGLVALGSSIAYGVKMFMNHQHLDSSVLFSITLLILGCFVLFLGLGWVPVRRLILKFCVPHRLAVRLRPVEGGSSSQPFSLKHEKKIPKDMSP